MSPLQPPGKYLTGNTIAPTVIAGILNGVTYWVVLLALSIILGSSGWLAFRGILLLHALFSIAQGITAFVVFKFAITRLHVDRLWIASLFYGLFLWAAGAAPLLLSDIAARYMNIPPISLGIEVEITRQISADVLLAMMCGFYFQLDRRLRSTVGRKELEDAVNKP
jgi:hypothetical protein